MTRREFRTGRLRSERGQAAILLLGVAAALLVGVAVLAAFGQALGAKGRHQRAADLAAMSAARAMSRAYPRLFEASHLENGQANPRHLSTAGYVSLARSTAIRVARRNGVRISARDVTFPDGGFAPARITVSARGRVGTSLGGRRRPGSIAVRGRATAAVRVAHGAAEGIAVGCPAFASGGGYDGPLACRMGKAMRPDVAAAFDRMAAAAQREAGLSLSITSAFRSDAEQARLWAANPNPKWVAPPGTSLHRYATELDLGPPAAYGWLAENARRFGFIQRYRWVLRLARCGADSRVPLAFTRESVGGMGLRHSRAVRCRGAAERNLAEGEPRHLVLARPATSAALASHCGSIRRGVACLETDRTLGLTLSSFRATPTEGLKVGDHGEQKARPPRRRAGSTAG